MRPLVEEIIDDDKFVEEEMATSDKSVKEETVASEGADQ